MAQLRISVYLLVAAIAQWLDGSMAEQCRDDEYYDGVTDLCAPCKEVCEPCHERHKNFNFCITMPKCAAYYDRVCVKKESPKSPALSSVLLPRPSSTESIIPQASPVILPITAPKAPTPNVLANPLLWLSISCIFLAILAILVVVCVMVYYVKSSPRRDSNSLLLPRETPGYTRSISQASSSATSCSNCQDKKCVVTINPEKDRMLSVPDIQNVHCQA